MLGTTHVAMLGNTDVAMLGNIPMIDDNA